MKFIFILFIFFFIQSQLHAQVTSDALLFSETHSMANARSTALGNALGAIGGDLSTANLNPAGVAFFNKMELSLSVGAWFNNTKTNFLGNYRNDRMSQFSLGGVGLVFSPRIHPRSNVWKSTNIGVTFNRIANYTRNFTYQGTSTGSRVQSFAQNATGVSPANLDPYEGWGAYNAYLIDTFGGLNYYSNGGISDSTYTNKYQNVKRTGGVNELAFTTSHNYNDKLYLGVTVGIDFMSMNEDRLYQETSDSTAFQAMTFTENRKVRGTGINIKLGAIYRINELIRVGLAVHSPTVYRLVDSYNSGLYGRIVYDGTLKENNYKMEEQVPNTLEHCLTTPWVFLGSVGLVIPKRGFIGLAVEYTDYNQSSFSLSENEKTATNNQFINNLNSRVQRTYQGILKAKIGAEIVAGLARIRLGYQFQTSPYKTTIKEVTDFRHDISAGIGLRWEHFYLDFAYNHTFRDFEYSPYNHPRIIQRVIGVSQSGQAMLTLGVLINYKSRARMSSRNTYTPSRSTSPSIKTCPPSRSTIPSRNKYTSPRNSSSNSSRRSSEERR